MTFTCARLQTQRCVQSMTGCANVYSWEYNIDAIQYKLYCVTQLTIHSGVISHDKNDTPANLQVFNTK